MNPIDAGEASDGESVVGELGSREGAKASANVARRAGRGGVAVLGAKVFFIVSGLLQQAGLSRALGQNGYGELARVLAVANVVNNVVVAGSTQGVSRAVAQSKGNDAVALRRALRIHAPIAVFLAIAFAAAAPLIARFEHAPKMISPLWIMSAVVLLYGLYAPLVGSLNGRGLFERQAGLDVLFATLRTALMIALAFVLRRIGAGVIGATAGFVIAAVMILIVAVRLAGTGKEGEARSLVRREYLMALGPLVLAQFFVNLVMQADIVLIGRFLVEGATKMGLDADAAQIAANDHVAVYRACQLFAFLPYQLLLSITQILFPMVAHARAAGDDAKVREYVRQGSRLGIIATGALVSVIAASPQSLIHFLYSEKMAIEGASTLRILSLGQGAFAILAIASTILASIGRERSAARLTLLALVLSVGFCWTLVSRASFGEDQLMASAVAVGAALTIAMGVGVWLVKRATGAFVSLMTACRVIASVAITVFIASKLPVVGRALVPFVCVFVVGLYLGLMVMMRELRGADFSLITSALRRRAKQS